MSKPSKASTLRSGNAERKNGKASKQHPKTGREGANGKTVGGYAPAALLRREQRRTLVNRTRSQATAVAIENARAQA